MVKTFFTYSKTNRAFALSALLFLLLYSSISLVNHYFFRTYALDLGLYTNAVYDYAHFHFSNSEVMQANAENLLADHFDLFLILISPLYYLFGSYTLLLIQIAAVMIGGAGVYRFCIFLLNDKTPALFVTLAFYSFFGIFSAFTFDYHSNVIAAMIVPWFLFFFYKGRWKACSVSFLLILITKENMSLWMFFIAIALIFIFKGDKLKTFRAVVFAVVSLVWFIAVIGFVMPALANANTYIHQNYHVLGNNFTEVLKTIITHPLHTLKLLFVNPTSETQADWVKTELHVFVFLSGVFLLLRKPLFLLMLVPVYFQKMFHDNYAMWSIDGQYSVEFAPVIAIGAACVVQTFKSKRLQNTMSVILFLLTLAVTIRSFDHTVYFIDRSRQRIYQPDHWQREFDVKRAYAVMSLIPDDAAVSAQSIFVPHLSAREHIYQFPVLNDAEYVLVCITENAYPLTKAEFENKIVFLLRSKVWKVKLKDAPFLLLEKR